MAKKKPGWLEALERERFFVGCSRHEKARKNEKNICCLDCCWSICPHCVPAHSNHSLVQVRRYVYHDVLRLQDLDKLIDCSNVQSYTINSSKVVFIKKRPQNRHFKGSGNICTSCDRALQEPYLHCSLGCKVDYILKQKRDLSAYLRSCESLQLSPDFFIPQEAFGVDDDMNESTVVEGEEEPTMASSDSETLSMVQRKEFNRKETSGEMHFCGRSANRVSEEDDSSASMSRRKGIPHRSPLC